MNLHESGISAFRHERILLIFVPFKNTLSDIMKHLTRTFAILSIGAAIISCATPERKVDAIAIDHLAEEIERMQDGDSVSVRGFCTDVCGHGSEHITLMGEDSVNAINAIADASLGSFDDALKYRYVTVHGILREQ